MGAVLPGADGRRRGSASSRRWRVSAATTPTCWTNPSTASTTTPPARRGCTGGSATCCIGRRRRSLRGSEQPRQHRAGAIGPGLLAVRAAFILRVVQVAARSPSRNRPGPPSAAARPRARDALRRCPCPPRPAGPASAGPRGPIDRMTRRSHHTEGDITASATEDIRPVQPEVQRDQSAQRRSAEARWTPGRSASGRCGR